MVQVSVAGPWLLEGILMKSSTQFSQLFSKMAQKWKRWLGLGMTPGVTVGNTQPGGPWGGSARLLKDLAHIRTSPRHHHLLQ